MRTALYRHHRINELHIPKGIKHKLMKKPISTCHCERSMAISKVLAIISFLAFNFLLATNSFAQQSQIDSLKQVVVTAKQGGDKQIIPEIKTLYKLGIVFWETKLDSAFIYLSECVERGNIFLLKEHEIPLQDTVVYYTAKAYNSLGNISTQKREFEEGLINYNKSLKLYTEINNNIERIKVFANIGVLYKQKNNLEEAILFYKKSLELSRKINNKEGIGKAYLLFAGIHEKKGDNIKAIEFYNKSLEIYTEVNDKEGEALVYNNLAIIYFRIGETDKSLDYFKKTISIQGSIP